MTPQACQCQSSLDAGRQLIHLLPPIVTTNPTTCAINSRRFFIHHPTPFALRSGVHCARPSHSRDLSVCSRRSSSLSHRIFVIYVSVIISNTKFETASTRRFDPLLSVEKFSRVAILYHTPQYLPLRTCRTRPIGLDFFTPSFA